MSEIEKLQKMLENPKVAASVKLSIKERLKKLTNGKIVEK